MIGPFAATMFAAIWVLLLEIPIFILSLETSTMTMVRQNDKLAQSYVRAWGEAPNSSNDLRLFARSTRRHYFAFDAWGERLEYLRLGKINYTIRSFGGDGVQNRPGMGVDPGVFRWGLMADKGLRYSVDDGAMHARPSVVLFAGADDSKGNWHAKLFVDAVSGSRRLLVRSRHVENFYMLAPHDGVEEFLWIPGEEKIAFTASQSARYADGLYIWDLKKDEATNLFALDGEMSDLNPGGKQRGLYVALSAVRAIKPPSVSVFAASSSAMILDPGQFFHPQNLHVFELGDQVRHVRPRSEGAKQASLFDLEFLGVATVEPGGTGNVLQRAWLKLPLGGDWDKAVMEWQEFASSHGKSQLAPYAVWGIAMFYGEAMKSAGAQSREGRIFYGYSIELGQALSQMSVAPGYIRAIGSWMGSQH